MKYTLAALLAVASTASAHYTLPQLTVKGVKTGEWTYVRKTTNYQTNGTPSALYYQTFFFLRLTTPSRPRHRRNIKCHPLLRALPRHRRQNLHCQRWRHGRLHDLNRSPRNAPVLPRKGTLWQDCRYLGRLRQRVVQNLQPGPHLLRRPALMAIQRQDGGFRHPAKVAAQRRVPTEG